MGPARVQEDRSPRVLGKHVKEDWPSVLPFSGRNPGFVEGSKVDGLLGLAFEAVRS